MSPPHKRVNSEDKSSGSEPRKLKRRKKMDGLKRAGASPDGHEGSAGFDSLPDEMLIKVFSYLGHGDKLCARQVNKRWCYVLSVWPGFCNSTFYLLKHGTDSEPTLAESMYTWKKVRVEKYRLTSKESLDLPSRVLENVMVLELSKCIFVWPVVKELIASFPALESVAILQCKRQRTKKKTKLQQSISTSDRMTRGSVCFQDKWSISVRNIKSVHLIVRRVSDLILYLQEFLTCKLTSFQVSELFDGVEITTHDAAVELMDLLYQLMDNSRMSLQLLSFKLASMPVLNLFCPKLIDRLCDLGLNLQVLAVENISSLRMTNVDEDVKILRKFLRTQRNLIKVSLPRYGIGSAEELHKLMLDIPKTVKYLHAPHYKYMLPNFLDLFPDLQFLEVHSDIKSHSLNKVYPKITVLEAKQDIRCESVPEIIKAFPSLVELNLNGFCHDLPLLDDRSLQTICKTLKSLRSLILGGCSRVTDFGVTGFRNEFCQRLHRSRSMCLDPKQSVPKEDVVGVKLCSLKGLKRLEINGPTNITDVGIYYGFRFQELRYLRLQENNDVTDWGYEQIGKLNPDLEELIVGYGQWVSPVGLNSMKSRLRRIKARNLLLLSILREYVSSDESYAMESGSDTDSIAVLIRNLP